MKRNRIGPWVRTISGLLIASLLWFGIGSTLASFELGLSLFIWTILVGPVVSPIAMWVALRLFWSLSKIPNTREHPFLKSYLRTALSHPGPHIDLWVRRSDDVTLHWFETTFFGAGRQVLIVSTRWLNLSESQKARDWQKLWEQIAAQTTSERRLRTLQMALWMTVMSPFEVLAQSLQALQFGLGLSKLPGFTFWLQRSCWLLRELWFGTLDENSDRDPLDVMIPTQQPYVVPHSWHSVIWGVWGLVPRRNIHASWPLLTHSRNFL